MERISFVNKSVFTHGIVCALCLSLLFACSSSNDEPTTKDAVSVEATITERNSFGNFLLDLSLDSLKKKGFDVGDIVTVSGGSLPGSLDMPITSFTLAAVVSYLHNKCGLSYDEIERLKNLISLSEN